ncbi:indolepyruvate oxidoreductase subunit beta [candidate division KSB1 bacterium]|nr:MAG: indolepyruvate oxidoreductase subunit beta [candidate division KSB1 bacterium]
MENGVINLLFAGVGGQGVLLAGELTARTAIDSGFDAKKSEVHGVAQRGGSVVSHVRFGKKVYSPLCWCGKVDIFLAFEKLEALRWGYYVKKGGKILVNNQKIQPAQFLEKPVSYPENILTFLTNKGYDVYSVDCIEKARELGNVRVFNVILLGFASKFLSMKEDSWIRTLKMNFSEKLYKINEKAFLLGREIYEKRKIKRG